MYWKELVNQAEQKESNLKEGEYFVIQYRPEVLDEVLNLGVCLIDENNNFYLKTIKDFGILNQIWSNAQEITELAMAALEEVFSKEGYPCSPSPQITYTKLRFTRFKIAEDCVESLYRDFVTHDPSIKDFK